MISSLFALLLAAAAPDPRPLVLTGGTIVDVSASGTRTNDIRDAVIVMRGDRIVAAGPRKSTKIPRGARIVPIDGAYVVPGLSDVFAGLNSQAQANAYLYLGVTSIVGSDEPGGRRGALLRTAKPSPRIRPLGFIHGVREDHSDQTTEEILASIDRSAGDGAEVLLLHYRLTPEQTRQAVQRARKLGLPIIGELGRTTYTEGIALGFDAFVHTGRYSLELATPELHAAVANDPFGPPRTTYYQFLADLDADDPAVARWGAQLARSRIALIPTMSLHYLSMPGHGNPWDDEIAAILDPANVHLPADRRTGQRDLPPGFPPGWAESVSRIEERYRRAGARYLAGSGTSAFGTLPGISLHNELRMFTGIGLTPRQALAAATSNVGEVFGWKKTGQVKRGFDADLVIVDADPTTDIRHLRKIRMVIFRGEIVDREALRK